MKRSKKIIAIALAAVVVSSAGFISWKQVKAEENGALIPVGTSGIMGQSRIDAETYWVDKTAPVCPNYVFGGWYQNEDLNVPATSADNADFAKWVPDYVLSVKAQIEYDAEDGLVASGAEGKTSTYIRIISSTDDEYSDYGFRVILNKKAGVVGRDATYRASDEVEEGENNFALYSALRQTTNNQGDYERKTPDQVFGKASKYFYVAQIPTVTKANENTTIYVQPFWVTPDGTEVQGLAKYVRVSDRYTENDYISVPVNLVADADIAAGVVTMTYPKDYEVMGISSGIGLPSVNFNDDSTEGKITFIAETSPKASTNSDGSTVTSYVGNTFTDIDPSEYTYVNVWFKAKDSAADAGQLTFRIEAGDFCNWHEEDVNVTSRGDYRY